VITVDSHPEATVPGDQVKRVSTVVSWVLAGASHSVSFTTAIAERGAVAPLPSSTATPSPTPTGTPSRSINSFTLKPDPLPVNTAGVPDNSVLVACVMIGYATSEFGTISWTDDAGAKTDTATSTDGSNWSVTIPSSNIRKAVAVGATATLTFTATTSQPQTTSSSLTVRGPTVTPAPTVNCTAGTPSLIRLGNGNGNNISGKNVQDVTLTCVTSGLSTSATQDSVKVSYPGQGGKATEVALQQGSIDRATWSITFERHTTYFMPGATQAFTYNVLRTADNASTSQVVLVQVEA